MANRKPTPPSGFRTSEPQTRQDLHDLRRYLEQVNVRLDEIEADMDAHEADVANPHAVTKAQVGLGNVDDVKQLAYDVNTYADKALPVYTDKLWIADSAAGDAPKRGTFASSRRALSLSYSYLNSPRETPHALDDEFSGGSPDLAARGWTVKNQAGATMTRVGDVQPWAGNALLTATQYRSTMTAAGLVMYAGAGAGEWFVTKNTASLGNNLTVAANIAMSKASDGSDYVYLTMQNTDSFVGRTEFLRAINYSTQHSIDKSTGGVQSTIATSGAGADNGPGTAAQIFTVGRVNNVSPVRVRGSVVFPLSTRQSVIFDGDTAMANVNNISTFSGVVMRTATNLAHLYVTIRYVRFYAGTSLGWPGITV